MRSFVAYVVLLISLSGQGGLCASDQNRTAGATLLRYGLDLASRWSGNLLRDYWPVFLAKISHAPRPDAGGN